LISIEVGHFLLGKFQKGSNFFFYQGQPLWRCVAERGGKLGTVLFLFVPDRSSAVR
jgi:hypothetical protein